MNDTHRYLAKTLIQRGESDNYILQRLQLAGLQNDEAYHLIQQTRQSSEAARPHFITESEGFFILLGTIGLLILLVWLLLQ